MTTHYEVLYMMPKFLERKDELIKQKPALLGGIDRKLKSLTTDCSRLDRKSLNGKGPKLFRTKVDKEIRLIDEPLDPERPSEAAILCVDHHDAALRFGERYNGDTMSLLSKAAVFSSKSQAVKGEGGRAPDARDPQSEASSTQAPAYGDLIPAKQLHRLEPSLSQEQASAILVQHTEEGLQSLGLDSEMIDRIETMRLQRSPSLPIAPPLPSMGAPRPVRVTREQLPAFLRMPLHKYLAVMTPRQKELAQRRSNRLYIIRGAAGSGKTVIGVRRVEHLLKQRDLFDMRPILFTCYNRSLRNALEQMVEGVLGADLAEERIEVTTIYQLLGSVAQERGLPGLPKLANATTLLPLVIEARKRVPEASAIGRWSDQDLFGEIREVLFGRALGNRDSYLKADRSGRGTGKGLDERSRVALWKIYETFRELCAAQNVTLWEHRIAQVMQSLEQDPVPEPRYAGVVIDEAQDLLPAAIRSLVALQAGNTDNMLILGDAAQNVYHSGFRWKHCGVAAAGGQFETIRECFRSTAPIVTAASPLIAGHDKVLEDDLVIPQSVERADPPPVSSSFHKNNEDEGLAVATLIGDILDTGVPLSAIGVLCDDYGFRKVLAAHLKELGYESEDLYKADGRKHIDLQAPSVKLLTTYSAKGLEFQFLFLPQVTESNFPTRYKEPDEANRSRRELYTAMMRCGWQLHLSAPSNSAAELFNEIDFGG